ncbi:uncharacterized protein J7T54_002975 [Emericellopsis cladophorae]|uniref:NACHT domain-containing protein n=1 Tax=Emericellopsis cladophorae TaxID=2686198 RepID=A0A9P9XVB3_9HYPO|nr:uncharacterized protein J7T54_002975 [Emericellopsis cladophorae]KAI6778351.1 hypothetical protein J7T54_002975 [Emericellopsis cladophorae]
MPTASDFINADFEIARRRFKESVGDPDIYEKVLQTNGSDEVTKLIKKAQEDAASSLGMRGMGRLEPFILRLKDFACVFETYVQIKPDLLALIWGPIRLLLLWSSEYYEAVDSVVDATEMIAQALSRFASMASLFNENQAVRSVHVLFLQDILDFYAAVLKFFGKWCSPARGLLSRVRDKVIEKAEKAFEIAWAAKKKELRVVIGNLEKHTRLLKNEVTFLEIEEAKKARDEALVKSIKDDEKQETQKFHGLRSRIAPVLYDKELDRLSNTCHSGGVNWLFRNPEFNHWLDVSKRDSTWLWLHGILGAGKTYLAAAAINHIKKSNQVLFVFASQENPDETALSSIQTLMFQAATNNAALRTVLVEASERELQGNTKYAANLLKSLLMSAGPAYIIIDGLDEIEEIERQILLQQLQMICKDCKELKVLISSRDVHDIERVLKPNAKGIRVDQRNGGAIQTYVNDRLKSWMAEHCDDIDSQSEIVRLLADLSAKAGGKQTLVEWARHRHTNMPALTICVEKECFFMHVS